MAEYIVCRGMTEHYQGSHEVVLVHPPVDQDLSRAIGKRALAPRTVDVEEYTPNCTQVSIPDWKKKEGRSASFLMAHGVASVLRAEGHQVDLVATPIRFNAHDDAEVLHEMMQALRDDAKAA